MLATTAAQQRSASPFPGLRSFSQDESEVFFGREGQSDELARKLGDTRFVAVVGTSGSGKSSLVRAGLLPSLDGGCLVKSGSNWRIVDMRPGGRPNDHLATALDGAKISKSPVDPEQLRNSSLALIDLARSAYEAKLLNDDENLLILVDQFEELFRYRSRDMTDRDEKAAFVKLLLEVAKQRDFPVYVVITMRSDFLGDCARFRDLPETINAGQYLVPRMTRDQRREAIEGPIHMAGGMITPRLVQRILNDAGEDPDQLPLMQHALMRTWHHWSAKARKDVTVDIPDYEAIGTLESALSAHADEAYAEACATVPDRGRQIVRHIFQCLRERDASGRETRRPTSLWELCAVAEASTEQALAILECFRQEGRSFLMPPMSVNLKADLEVDITHESLLRQWKRLLGPLSEEDEGWLAEEEESRRILMRLADRVEQQTQGSTDYLRGPLLQLALEWWERRKPTRAWANRYTRHFDAIDRFLRESEENRTREVQLEAEHRKKEEQARVEQVRREEELKSKQLKIRGAYIFGALALVVAAVTVALLLYAMQQSKIASDKENIATENVRIAREQQQKAITAEANLKALKAQQQADLAEANAKEQNREKEEARKDAANAKIALNEIKVQFLALEAGTVGTEGQSAPLGMLLAAESMRRQPLIQNLALLSSGLQLLPTFLWDLPNSAVQLTTFSPNGLLVTSGLGMVQVWDPVAKKQVRQFPIAGKVGAIAVSKNGELLGVAYDEENQGIIRVYNLHTGLLDGQRLTEPGTGHLFVGSNGNLTAFNGSLYHWKDWSDPGGVLPGTQAVLRKGGAVATSSDQSLYALFDRDKSKIVVLDLKGNNNSWSMDQASVSDIVFDPSDEHHLAAFDYGGTIRLWDTRSQQPYLTFQAGPLVGIEFSADGRFLAASGSDGSVKAWDTRDGRAVASGFTKTGGATTVALDGLNRIVAVTQKTSTQLWQISEVPLPSRIISAQISADAGLATLRTTQSNALFWKIPDARAESTMDLSLIKTVLGVMPRLRLAAGTCDSGFVCVVLFEKDKPGTLIRKSKQEPYPSSLMFNRDGRFVAGSFSKYAGGRRTSDAPHINTMVWDIKNPEAEPEIILDGSDPLNATLLGFLPGSDLCILRRDPTKAGPGEVVLWDSNKRTLIAVPKAFQQHPLSIAFSVDGHWLATSQLASGSSPSVTDQKYTVGIWRWPDGEQLFKTFEVDTRVNKMSFSSDGNLLITAGAEAFIRVWDIKTGKENSRVILNRPGVPLAIAFADGDRRIVAFDQYSVLNTRWRPEDLMKEACERIGRSLTTQEWDKYLPTEKGQYFPTCEAYLPSH
jgi:WD40 repeat protein/energy-coupling factor transporter ATP-binding protein EcfA2